MKLVPFYNKPLWTFTKAFGKSFCSTGIGFLSQHIELMQRNHEIVEFMTWMPSSIRNLLMICCTQPSWTGHIYFDYIAISQVFFLQTNHWFGISLIINLIWFLIRLFVFLSINLQYRTNLNAIALMMGFILALQFLQCILFILMVTMITV